MGDAVAGRLSLVVEMDNAAMLTSGEISEMISSLADQLRNQSAGRASRSKPQLIFVHPGTADHSDLLKQLVAGIEPELEHVADLEFFGLEGGRYYELKNRGVAAARGDIVVFLDSDTVPETDWLRKLIQPLDSPGITATNGYTSLLYDDFLSRVFALFWIFPLRYEDDRTAGRRPLVANNCAFRRDWIAANPFPENTGFKVSCSILFDRMQKEGIALQRVDAHVRHKPPRGWRFFVWRALVAGRDADRRFKALKSGRMAKRVANSFGRFLTAELRASRRLAYSKRVGITLWQMPFAFALISLFYLLTFLSQTAMALGLTQDAVERLPDYIERS